MAINIDKISNYCCVAAVTMAGLRLSAAHFAALETQATANMATTSFLLFFRFVVLSFCHKIPNASQTNSPYEHCSHFWDIFENISNNLKQYLWHRFPYTEDTQNLNPILRITIDCTQYTKNANERSNKPRFANIFEHFREKQNETQFFHFKLYHMYKLHHSYFV